MGILHFLSSKSAAYKRERLQIESAAYDGARTVYVRPLAYYLIDLIYIFNQKFQICKDGSCVSSICGKFNQVECTLKDASPCQIHCQVPKRHCIYIRTMPYPSVLDFWKIKFENSSSTNWIFNLQKSISKLIFAGYTGSKNQVRTRQKIKFVSKSIFFFRVCNKLPNWHFKNQAQIDTAIVSHVMHFG